MRENMGLYRGKRFDNGKWVSGGSIIQFLDDGVRTVFIPQFNEKCTTSEDKHGNLLAFESGVFYKVDPSTVGQFTGLVDKNGVKVFEGDIVHAHTDGLNGDKDIGIIRFGHYRHADASREYMCGDYGFYIDWVSDCYLRPDIMYWLEYMEVIGNIHDNHELLEPSKNPAK